MPSYELLPLDADDRWNAALDGLPHGFSHTWDHAYAMSLSTGIRPFLWLLHDGRSRIACPLIERSANGYADIATPSGFSGFVGNSGWRGLEQHWLQFTRNRDYVTGYIGLHPLFIPPRGTFRAPLVRHNVVYVLDLTMGIDKLRRGMDRNRRRELRDWSSRADGLIQDPGLIAEFLARNYGAFMDARGARGPLFGPDALRHLCHSDRCLAIGAVSSGQIEAASVFGLTPAAGEALVNISTEEGRRHTTDMIWWAVRTLIEKGVPALVLGGGVSPGDRIAEAKQRWRPNALPLLSLRDVYRPDIYRELCARAGVDPSSSRFFPAYHDPGRTVSPSA